MKVRRAVIILATVLLVVVAVYIIGVVPVVRAHAEMKRTSSALHNISRDRLAAALQEFVRNHNTNKTALPLTVPLDELIRGRYLQLEDIRGLEKKDVIVSLTPDMAVPQTVLIRVHSSNTSDLALLADGSVQGLPRE